MSSEKGSFLTPQGSFDLEAELQDAVGAAGSQKPPDVPALKREPSTDLVPPSSESIALAQEISSTSVHGDAPRKPRLLSQFGEDKGKWTNAVRGIRVKGKVHKAFGKAELPGSQSATGAALFQLNSLLNNAPLMNAATTITDESALEAALHHRFSTTSSASRKSDHSGHSEEADQLGELRPRASRPMFDRSMSRSLSKVIKQAEEKEKDALSNPLFMRSMTKHFSTEITLRESEHLGQQPSVGGLQAHALTKQASLLRSISTRKGFQSSLPAMSEEGLPNPFGSQQTGDLVQDIAAIVNEYQADELPSLNSLNIEHPALKAYKAGSLGVGFSGGGFLLPYHLGVAARFKELGIITPKTNVSGASAGSLTAVLSCTDMSLEDIRSHLREFAVDCRSGGTAGRFTIVLKAFLEKHLPKDIVDIVGERCHVAVVRVFPVPKTYQVSKYHNRHDLIEACLTSCHVPGYANGQLTRSFRGKYHIDGGLIEIIPRTPKVEYSVGVCCFPINFLKTFPLIRRVATLQEMDLSPDMFEPFDMPMSELTNLTLAPGSNEMLDYLMEKGRKDAIIWAQKVGIQAEIDMSVLMKSDQVLDKLGSIVEQQLERSGEKNMIGRLTSKRFKRLSAHNSNIPPIHNLNSICEDGDEDFMAAYNNPQHGTEAGMDHLSQYQNAAKMALDEEEEPKGKFGVTKKFGMHKTHKLPTGHIMTRVSDLEPIPDVEDAAIESFTKQGQENSAALVSQGSGQKSLPCPFASVQMNLKSPTLQRTMVVASSFTKINKRSSITSIPEVAEGEEGEEEEEEEEEGEQDEAKASESAGLDDVAESSELDQPQDSTAATPTTPTATPPLLWYGTITPAARDVVGDKDSITIGPATIPIVGTQTLSQLLEHGTHFKAEVVAAGDVMQVTIPGQRPMVFTLTMTLPSA